MFTRLGIWLYDTGYACHVVRPYPVWLCVDTASGRHIRFALYAANSGKATRAWRGLWA